MLAPNKIHQVDALMGLKELPDKCVDMVMTSPPYWSLRDYGEGICSTWGGDTHCQHDWHLNPSLKKSGGNYPSTASSIVNRGTLSTGKGERCVMCGAWRGQLGLEPDLDLYLAHLLEVFVEVKRVLKDTGTCWVNLGDTYAGGWSGHSSPKRKSLCLIPQRFSIGMVERGWLLRNTVIWHKPNCMPSSVRDRFTVDFDYLLFFSKNRKYYFDQQRESRRRPRPGLKEQANHTAGRNVRCVWNVSIKSFGEKHFAVYPERLCEIPIRAGCPKEVCTKCGTPRLKRVSGENPSAFKLRVRDVKEGRIKGPGWHASKDEVDGYDEKKYHSKRREETVFSCQCNASYKPGVVLDPFMGSGTTAVVAKRLGMNYIGFELNPDYVKIAEKRLQETAPQA